MDALADIAAVCLLLHQLAPDQILASPVCVGSGQVKCAHGVLPVPAPATAHLLKGVPSYSGAIQTELCTPTGAALLKRFASAFGERPTMQVGAIGYGMGKKELEAANCVRAFWGETQETGGDVRELSCNLDDMTAEAIAFAMETLLEAGALETLDVLAAPEPPQAVRPRAAVARPMALRKSLRWIFLISVPPFSVTAPLQRLCQHGGCTMPCRRSGRRLPD